VAGRRFDVADVVEVLQHWQAGRGTRELSRSLGMGRPRLRRILRSAWASGVRPGHGPTLSAREWRERCPDLFHSPHPGREPERRQRLSSFREAIEQGLVTNTVTTVWQRLHDESGLDISLSTFRRYVRDEIRMVRPEDVTVRKQPAVPGEVAEVDYGRLGVWTDPVTGGRHVVQAFVMTLCASRRVFVMPVLRCDQEAWTRCHVAAFCFFGGAPQQIRLDNLKTGVIRPDLYDPQLNRSYAELAAHYGVLLDPCRAAKPKDKPQVERNMPYVRDSFWKGREFSGVEQMEREAVRWCERIADRRPHRHLTGTVGEVFTRLEQTALRALPAEPFEMAHWATATVHPDCHIQVRGHRYSVPWRLVGRQLDVRVGERLVTIHDGGTLVKAHLRRRGERLYTDPEDFPEQKIAFLLRTPAWCRRRAAELGPEVAALVDEMLAEPAPLSRLRQAQGLVRLAESHPRERLDAACRRAREADGSLRTVRNLLLQPPPADDGRTHQSDAGAFLHGEQTLLEGVK